MYSKLVVVAIQTLTSTSHLKTAVLKAVVLRTPERTAQGLEILHGLRTTFVLFPGHHERRFQCPPHQPPRSTSKS